MRRVEFIICFDKENRIKSFYRVCNVSVPSCDMCPKREWKELCEKISKLIRNGLKNHQNSGKG